MTSFSGIIDLLSFLPYYMPIFFPAGASVFRMLRAIRIFRLFQINAYYDSLSVIAEGVKDDLHIDLKDLVLLKHSPWNGLRIRDLDISRQTIIVMVKRKGTVLVPRGDLMLLEGDHVILYSQERISHASTIQV